MKALILAAGYATRLYPLTLNIPKPLLPIKGKLMINYIIEKLEEVHEISEIYVITNDKFFKQFQHWKETLQCSKRVMIINDHTKNNDDRLGAVGDMHFVIQKNNITDDLMVIAGDNLFDFSLKEFIVFFKNKKGSVVALYDIQDKAMIAKKLGCAEINTEGRLIRFEEKPEHPKTTLAATACYVFTTEDIALLEKHLAQGGKLDNSGEFIHFLLMQKPVYGFTFQGKWHDIGSKEQYELVK